MKDDARNFFYWLPGLILLVALCPFAMIFTYQWLHKPAPAMLLSLVMFLAACGITAAWTQRQKLPAEPAPDALPDYADPKAYADAAATFYPEPKDYAEPARTAPVFSSKRQRFAFFSLLLAVIGFFYGVLAFWPGLVALSLSLGQCRISVNDKKEWDPTCRRCAQAAVVFSLATCLEPFFLFFF